MGLNELRTLWISILVLSVETVSAEEGCYGAGSIATSVVLSVIITLLIVGAILYWIRRRPRTEHLILETDPEKGKAEYAFDNPGFKDAGLTPLSKSLEKVTPKAESEKSGKHKWNNWPKLSALTAKTEKRKTLDDCVMDGGEVKVVALRSHDFTGLGFNICGNMKEGIYIKDILHRGPASESGRLNPGDRINSVTISFEHIVYEDALTILSYASPYEVIIEAKSGKILVGSSSKYNHPSHPIYRSSSNADLQQVGNSARKKLYNDTSFGSNHSTLHKSLSNMTTLERKDSKSPRPNQVHPRISENKNFNSEQLRNQLEQKISSAETEARLKNEPVRIEIETQKSENKHQKLGVKVFPTEQKSPKIAELSQNDNNINIEKNKTTADEVDAKKPQAGKRKKKTDESSELTHLNRNDSLNSSGLKRDANGIPQEIPSHMLNAAVAARRNRKSPDNINNDEEMKTTKKTKGKAPPPPEEREKEADLYEIKQLNEDVIEPLTNPPNVTQEASQIERVDNPKKNKLKGYNSDSEDEMDNQSSVNTIELNSSDITIHHEENEEKQNRKTASTGDLTKIHKTRKSSTGTLERAQSLDITDSTIPTLTKKRKGGKIEDSFDTKSEEDSCGKAMLNKEPRLSLILDGLNTFQRNRLKKSTEWGNLEDAILKSSQDDNSISPVFTHNISMEKMNFNFGEKSAELDALVNKINEIKRQSQEIDVINMETDDEVVKNQIWPSEIDKTIEIEVAPPPPIQVVPKVLATQETSPKPKNNIQNEIWPKLLDEKQVFPENLDSFTEVSLVEKQTNPEIIAEGMQSSVKLQDIPQEYSSTMMTGVIMTNGTTTRQVNGSKEEPILVGTITKTLMAENMIESETPPEAIDRQDFDIDSSTNMENIVSEKSKVHKRQQIPNTTDLILPPPEISDSNIEDEIFDELNRNPSPPNLMAKITPRTFICNSNSNIPSDVASHEMNGTMPKRNFETGELCEDYNDTDESKTLGGERPNYVEDTENLIMNERYSCSRDYRVSPEDTNISDDIKVSRHSLGSLERGKSDDAKSIESLKYSSNVSNVTINSVQTENGSSNLHSLEFSVNEPSPDERNHSVLSDSNELYTTALSKTIKPERDASKITISTPDLIKNVSITEAINTLNSDMDMESFEHPNRMEDIQVHKPAINAIINGGSKMNADSSSSKNHSSLTYITEIQVTPNNKSANISEIEIVPSVTVEPKQYSRNLDNEFENYVKNFDVKDTENIVKIKNEESKERPKVIVSDKNDPEKELHKIKEIAQEQLKKLPEMRFSTSSYESPSRIPEKRQSQIELLKSNFEKSPPKSLKTEIATKSRIPISTTMKTPPTSPERRDSRNLDMENDKEIMELMTSSVHSTPMMNSAKYQKSNNKNVTITSIRNNSKIPSGLPVLGGNRPPIPPKKPEQENDSIVQVSNSSINSFKQWVFDPVDSITNISLSGNKQDHK